MKKIYFYSPSDSAYIGRDAVCVTSVPSYLIAYLKRHNPDLVNKIQWTEIELLTISPEQLIADVNNLDIDILCVSVYVWNQDNVYNALKDIKQKFNKPVTIIAGGPSVDPHRNKSYLNDHPDIDYAVYAQGESAFASILEHIINQKPLSALNTKNLSWRDANGTIKTSAFEFIREKDGSPYLESADFLEDFVSKLRTNSRYSNYDFWFAYETSKGCAYNCTFCDWTSGLTHKVYHRQFSIEDEIDLLGRLGLTNIHIADSNFGQHRQDLQIAETMAKFKKEKGYQFNNKCMNLSKLRLNENFKILDVLIGADIVKAAKFSIQDTHDTILENIERPSVNWGDHLTLIKELRNKYPNTEYTAELIQGLPGQTRESWEETLIAIEDLTPPMIHYWIMLPDSPAGYDSEYASKMKLKSKSVVYYGVRYEVLVETYSYNLRDYSYFTLLSQLMYYEPVAAIKDRRLLFDKIKVSQHLNSVLDKIYASFDSPRHNDDVQKAVGVFLIQFFKEYQSYYPAEILTQLTKSIFGRMKVLQD